LFLGIDSFSLAKGRKLSSKTKEKKERKKERKQNE